MSRWISFVVLLGVIVVIAAFFLRVMAEFLVPLFVATLLVVIFRPVHLWYLKKTNNRPAWSALLTTITVILAVVLPFGIMLALAAAEGREIVKRFDKTLVLQKLDDFRSTFGLNVKHLDQLTDVEQTLDGIRNSVETVEGDGQLLSPKHFTATERSELEGLLNRIIYDSQQLGTENQLTWPPEIEELEAAKKAAESEGSGGQGAGEARKVVDSSDESLVAESSTETNDEEKSEADVPSKDKGPTNSFLQLPFGFSDSNQEEDLRPSGSSALEQYWFNYVYQLRETASLVNDRNWQPEVSQNRDLEWKLRSSIASSHARFREFKVHLMGGPLIAWLKELVNPQDDDVQQYSQSAVELIRKNFLVWGGTATVFLGRILFGGVIVIIAVYFFLLDGPAMMASVMQLSPMDDRHEKELIDEFERVSRAVVLATLVAAVAQGILAGFGFYFAGIQSIFLLTMLTMLLAMIPFFGATSVWLPVVLYVAFFENRPVTAFVLFLYCALIVSTIDNIIKPYILHGQSNLHPLLALLSVLGGVTALGAIGIMVGPMLVAFLQTLLKILRDELVTLDGSFAGGNPRLSADGVSDSVGVETVKTESTQGATTVNSTGNEPPKTPLKDQGTGAPATVRGGRSKKQSKRK